MRTTYRIFALGIAAAVVLQVASIALAGFTVAKDAGDGATIGADYSNFGQSYHSIAGTAIGLLALILLIVSFLTDVPRGRSLAGIIVGLVAVQFALAVVSFGTPALGVLHGINGLAIAGVAGAAARRSTELPVQPAAHV
jgi:choline-glycine betaine transporter